MEGEEVNPPISQGGHRGKHGPSVDNDDGNNEIDNSNGKDESAEERRMKREDRERSKQER